MDYSFRQYHEEVSKHAAYPDRGDNLVYPALGLAGETGELADKVARLQGLTLRMTGFVGRAVEKIKKLWRNFGLKGLLAHDYPHDRIDDPRVIAMWEGLRAELGDVLWYADAIATEMGSSLEEIAAMNSAKLHDRACRGVLKSEGDKR